jgi:uncharacterized membrane protein YfcA
MPFIHVDARSLLLGALAITTAIYVAILFVGLRRAKREAAGASQGGMASLTGTGFGTNFFDTLGIGSFATTTSIFRYFGLVRDEWIPGTLNVGHTIPTIVQAFIYTQLVPVDSQTLILMIGAAMLGAWLGAGVVASWPRRKIQIGMGTTLLGFAVLMISSQVGLTPVGGNALGLAGTRLAIAETGNVMLGALMTLGIGLYAPCMILISLLGMNPTTAYPIMMGSCAFLMPIASARFVRKKCFDWKAAIGLFVGGIPAVLIAAFIVKSLSLSRVKWLVVVVVLYTAASLLRTAYRERTGARLTTEPEVAA